MSPDEALREFCALLQARDPSAIGRLFAPNGLLEFPLLKPRLVGSGETREGFRRAFGIVSSCSIELLRTKRSATVAIAEGTFRAQVHRDDICIEERCAVVAVVSNGTVVRVSVHLDARPYRLWTDGPVLARGDVE